MKHLFPNHSIQIWKQFTKSERNGRFAGIFQERSFGDAHLNLYRVAVVGSYLCNLVSVATGFAFLYLLLAGLYADLPAWFQYAIFGVLSALLLCLLEYIKREALGSTAVGWLKGKKISIIPLLVIGVLVSISVYFSVEGASRFIKEVDKSVEETGLKQEETIETKALQFDQQITQQQDSLAKFKQSVSWKGRIDISNKAVASTIQHFVDKISRLESAKSEVINTMMKHSETMLGEVKATADSRAKHMVWIALGNEISCLLLILWVYYYAFRSYVEESLAGDMPSESKVSSFPNIGMFQVRNNVSQNQYDGGLTTPTMRKPIGFETGGNNSTAVQNGIRNTSTATVETHRKHTEGFKIICGQCQQEVVKHNKNARFCSESCRSNYHAERYKKKKKSTSQNTFHHKTPTP